MNNNKIKSTSLIKQNNSKSNSKLDNLDNNDYGSEGKINMTRNIKLLKKNLYNQNGILDPNGNEVNPLTNKPYINMYLDMDVHGIWIWIRIWI